MAHNPQPSTQPLTSDQTASGKKHHAWWEQATDPRFVAYYCWNSFLTGEDKGKPYGIPQVERLPYSAQALQRRYEAGRDIPPWWKPARLGIERTPDGSPEIRMNAELARLQVALNVDEGGRLWAVLRDVVRRSDGPGWLFKRDLPGLLAEYGIHYTPQHLRRIIRAYKGLYWNTNRQRLYLRGPAFVTEKLTQRCLDRGQPELVMTNQPGGKDMYLPLKGGLEGWRAYVYAGWLAYRGNPTISRATLSMLFGRDGDTLRRWEGGQLSQVVSVIEGRAQFPYDVQQVWFPDHAQRYVARVKNPESQAWELMPALYWRISNTYRVSGIRQHHRLGQGRKLRHVSGKVILAQPVDFKAGGMHRTKKTYFETPKALAYYLKKRGWSKQYRYLFKGENRAGILMFEPRLEVFFPERDTYPNERATDQEASRYHAWKRAKYRGWRAQQGGTAAH